jgi:hypothetical protein
MTSQKDRAHNYYSGIVVIFQGRCEKWYMDVPYTERRMQYVPVRSGENIPVFDSPERQPQHHCFERDNLEVS